MSVGLVHSTGCGIPEVECVLLPFRIRMGSWIFPLFQKIGDMLLKQETSGSIPRYEEIIILDEIGKMECFSERFREAALKALDSKNVVLGTIAVGGDDFIRGIKTRSDVKVYEVTLENRDRLPRELIDTIENLGCG